MVAVSFFRDTGNIAAVRSHENPLYMEIQLIKAELIQRFSRYVYQQHFHLRSLANFDIWEYLHV